MREIKFKVWDGKTMWDTKDLELEGVVFLQYIGLKDKNGKEIYEGDILEFVAENYYLGGKRMEVIYSKGAFIGWNKNGGLQAGGKTQRFASSKSQIEVIGNLYENPELLPPTN